MWKRQHKSPQVLGMNRRNVDFIYEYNQRKYYKLADDKVISKTLLEKHNFPTPKLIRVYKHFFELRSYSDELSGLSNFAIKPANGRGGGGIVIIDDFVNGKWITASGKLLDKQDMYQHATAILSGVYSLDNTNDSIIIEEKIQLHPVLKDITYKGIPDIRVIVFKQHPVMAMMRIPTKKSDGKANLHSGGIGVAIDIESGVTFVNPNFSNEEVHPDNGQKFTGITMPYWDDMISISRKIQEIVPLPYMGIDFILDERYGAQILELNVRPGLEIQNINGKGLISDLIKIADNI